MKKMMRLVLAFAICLVCSVSMVRAQEGFHVEVGFNYLKGLKETGNFANMINRYHKPNGFDFNIAGMYGVTDRLSAGLGIGVEVSTE